MSDLHKMSFRFLSRLEKTLGGSGKQFESSDSIPLCLFKMKDSLDICELYCVKRSFGSSQNGTKLSEERYRTFITQLVYKERRLPI